MEGLLAGGGVRYQGGFHGNKRHGSGTCWYATGEVYVGGWREGRRHGGGRVYEPDGSVFVGQWHKGKKKGDGYLECGGMKIAGYWEGEVIKG